MPPHHAITEYKAEALDRKMNWSATNQINFKDFRIRDYLVLFALKSLFQIPTKILKKMSVHISIFTGDCFCKLNKESLKLSVKHSFSIAYEKIFLLFIPNVKTSTPQLRARLLMRKQLGRYRLRKWDWFLHNT